MVPNENLNQSVKDLINAAIEYEEKFLTINFSQSEFDKIDQNYFLEEFKNKIIFEKNKLIFHDKNKINDKKFIFEFQYNEENKTFLEANFK